MPDISTSATFVSNLDLEISPTGSAAHERFRPAIAHTRSVKNEYHTSQDLLVASRQHDVVIWIAFNYSQATEQH